MVIFPSLLRHVDFFGLQQRCVKVEKQFTFIDRWELEVLLIYWGFYIMTPTPQKKPLEQTFPLSLFNSFCFFLLSIVKEQYHYS